MSDLNPRAGRGRPPRADFPADIKIQLPEELRKQCAAFHKACGVERYPHETLRELIAQALSGDAVSTAAYFARREVFRQVQAWTMSEMQQFLNGLKQKIQQIIWNINDGDVSIVVPEDPNGNDGP